MGEPKKVDCLFCGVHRERGREHVFAAAWLDQYQAGQERIEIDRRRFDDDSLLHSRNHTFASFVCGDVCEICNIGWMSRLEELVKPWILAIADKGDLKMLQNSERRLPFSRWALKTACVIDRLGGSREIPEWIPRSPEQHHERLPESVYVFVGIQANRNRVPLLFNKRNTWGKYPRETAEIRDRTNPEEGWFKVAFAVQQLMVLVVGKPGTGNELVIGGNGIHTTIWPQTKIERFHWYHSMRLEGQEPAVALERFSDLVCVFQV